MLVKTSNLFGAALDWAVARCVLGKDIQYVSTKYKRVFLHDPGDHREYLNYSTNWSQGGPIIERERIGVLPIDSSDQWRAFSTHNKSWAQHCFVVSKLGDEVEIPDELL